MPLTREESYGKVILYDVKQEFLSREKRQKRSPSNSKTLNTTATFVVLYDLPLCSRYNVFVRAYTKAGPGPYTQPRVLETSSEYDHDVLAHKHVHVMHDDENISGILFNQNLFSGICKYQRKPCMFISLVACVFCPLHARHCKRQISGAGRIDLWNRIL